MRCTPLAIALIVSRVCGACGGGDPVTSGADAGAPDAGARPVVLDTAECAGETLLATRGKNPMVISTLAIGAGADGFDLDGDGVKDNKLGGLAQLARMAIEEAFTRRDLIVPFEMADVSGIAEDGCVKLAFYVGRFKLDRDGDGKLTTVNSGDCDDHDPAIAPGKPEVAGNGKDDDCDGKADEGGPADTQDRDGDGVTVSGGDCDDTQATVGKGAEVCGDGRDNDCDGAADKGCNPYDDSPDVIAVEPLSIDGDKPKVLFGAATISAGGQLVAGPNFFAAAVPVTTDVSLDLRISGARLSGDLVSMSGGPGLKNARVGGILAAGTLDDVRGIDVPQIGLGKDDSLLDLIFANVLGIALALPRHPSGCLSPDIDVDGDGREAFCDTTGEDGKLQVDLCIDGDGTMVRDENGKDCTKALDARGKPRFVDGVSVALTFEAVPALRLTTEP